MRRVLEHESGRPGRKIILCVFPGWPVLSGPQHMLDSNQEQEFFGDIVDISTQLREFQITLYTVDPLDKADFGLRAPDWEAYLKGVSKPSQVRSGNLALEVIATQSGSLALNARGDLAAQLQQCFADTGTYYEIYYDPAITGRADEYHMLEIRVARPGLTARTRQGYYSRPWRGGILGQGLKKWHGQG